MVATGEFALDSEESRGKGDNYACPRYRDSRAMRAMLGKILKEIGLEVAEASHGCEGLERLKQIGRTELALVDWNMPERNGFEFVCAGRAEPTYKDIRLMMVTTKSEIGAMTSALEAGANECVMKPFTKEVTLEKLALPGIET